MNTTTHGRSPADSHTARGRTFRPPVSRRTTIDLLRLTKNVPTHSQMRRCRVPLAMAARAKCSTRIGWPMLFFKSYAIVCNERPELRRVFLTRPWGRIYEHPHAIGRMTVAREMRGEDWVVLTKVDDPANIPLTELQADVTAIATSDPDDVVFLGRQIKLASMPWWVRRLSWMTMNWFGPWRTKWLGTFGMTTVSKFGATAICPPVFAGTTLSFGPVDDDGGVDVVLTYDHRVVDGAVPAQALEAVEQTLETLVAAELLDITEPTVSIKIS